MGLIERDRSGDAATKRALMAVSARDPEGAADRIMRLEGELEASRQQLRGAVEACERWREWCKRAAEDDEGDLWRKFAVAMDLLCDDTLGGQ
jgi:hypothetical protein